MAAAEPGSPIASWGAPQFTALGIEMFKASISQFMHGEQGAMLTAAKIVETVPWIDAKYYAATQTMDEARHTEVFAKYLDQKVGEAYPMSPFLEEQITSLLEDSRWDIAYLGMQIVIESLALAAFGDMLRRTEEPLLRKLLRYVMSDEARHVAFGILTLKEFYTQLSDAELKDRQEFLLDNTLRNRARSTTPEVWERLGVDLHALMPHLSAAAGKMKASPVRRIPAGVLRQAGPQCGQARTARRQPRLPPRAMGRCRPPRVRARRRHRLRLRVLRRGGQGPARQLVKVDPDGAGFDGARLERLTEHFADRYVTPGKIAGCQIAVTRGGRLAYWRSLGLMDRERAKAVEDDTIWRIYSMTKPITSVALMQLYERGLFQLTDPVAPLHPRVARPQGGRAAAGRLDPVWSSRTGRCPSATRSPT